MFIAKTRFNVLADGTTDCYVNCDKCGKLHSINVPTSSVRRWNSGQGEFVQSAFPMLSADERELFFITGICAPCWTKMMGAEE